MEGLSNLVSMPSACAPISVIIPVRDRLQQLLLTLTKIKACNPPPQEILVFFDGNDQTLIDEIRVHHPDVHVLGSESPIGPGGGRNILVEASCGPLIASFDDDSYPATIDYFGRVIKTFKMFENAAILGAKVVNRGGDFSGENMAFQKIGEFSGCGCIYKKSWFEKTRGYVPRVVAYGMEECDVSLQIHDLGGMIIEDSQLRVIHDRSDDSRFTTEMQSDSVVNSALFPFLRYPLWLLPMGLWHLISKIIWELKHGRWLSVCIGLWRTPGTLWRFSSLRHPVSSASVLSWLHLRRNSVAIEPTKKAANSTHGSVDI